MFRGETEGGAGIQAAAEVTAHGNIGAQAEANGFLQHVPEFRNVVGIGALRRRPVGFWIIEIPISMELDVLFSCEQEVSGRYLTNSVKQRTHRMTAAFNGLIDGLGIPTRGHSSCEQGLYFRRDVERFFMEGIEQRLDAEA